MINTKLIVVIFSCLYFLTACVLPPQSQRDVPLKGKVYSQSMGSYRVSETWENLGRKCEQLSKLFNRIDDIVFQEAKNENVEIAASREYLDGVERELANISKSCQEEYLYKWKNYFLENTASTKLVETVETVETVENGSQYGSQNGSQLTENVYTGEQVNDPRFQKGQTIGSSLIRNAWNSFGQQCEKLPELYKIVNNAVKKIRQDVQRGKKEDIFARGYENGLQLEMTEIETEENQCR